MTEMTMEETEERMFALHTSRGLEDTEEDGEGSNDTSEVLRTTFRLYGVIFVVLFCIYCFVRRRYPGAYNVRNTYEHLKCDLAANSYGVLSWIWGIFFISDLDLFEQCGLDAIALIRILQFGMKLSIVGIFNSIFLIPSYGTAKYSEETADVNDTVQQLSLSHVPPGSPVMIATVVAAYILFGAAMYLILQEFKWYTVHRHVLLSKPQPNNYTICVSGLPLEYRSNQAIRDYFNDCLCQDTLLDTSRDVVLQDCVLETNIVLSIPKLEKLVMERDALDAKLTHAINVRDIQGKTPMHKTKKCGGEKVDSIETYSKEMEEKNNEILRAISKIEASTESKRQTSMRGDVDVDANLSSSPSAQEQSGDNFADDSTKSPESKRSSSIMNSIRAGKEDGDIKDVGFVSFRNLRSTMAALQMVHHESPFEMQRQEAPLPEDILWNNIGKSNKQLQLGKLLSLTLTTTLCLLWTIPVSFVAALNDVDALQDLIPFLEDWIETAPWLSDVLAQLAPLLVVVLIALLPTILLVITKLEGSISDSSEQASLFLKLSAFMIIQTFFVSAVSGSIFTALQDIIDDPLSTVDLLATSLPAQASYFMQILLVQTFIGVGVELLRIGPVVVAFIRGKVGPSLTDEERNATWLGLRPFSDPAPFLHAIKLYRFVLYFMVLFVYSCMSPIVSYIALLCFGLLTMCYRNQFVYCYPFKETGGKLWGEFTNIMVVAMLISEIVLTGVLVLKKSIAATVLIVPLIVITSLFKAYIDQQHYFVTKHLPGRRCIEVDRLAHGDPSFDFSFVEGTYIQNALRADKNIPGDAEQMVESIEVEA